MFWAPSFPTMSTNERCVRWGIDYMNGSKFKWHVWLINNMQPVVKIQHFQQMKNASYQRQLHQLA